MDFACYDYDTGPALRLLLYDIDLALFTTRRPNEIPQLRRALYSKLPSLLPAMDVARDSSRSSISVSLSDRDPAQSGPEVLVLKRAVDASDGPGADVA